MKDSTKKRLKEFLGILGLLCILTAILAIVLQTNDNLRFKFDYESENHKIGSEEKTIKVTIPWKNPIVYLKRDEIIDTLKSKTGIVYFGYPSCPWCRNVVPILLEVAIQEKVSVIYYVDIHEIDDQIQQDLKELLDEYLKTDDETNEKILAVPDVYFIKEGTILGHHISTVESYKNPYKGMNDKQKQELKNIYLEYIKELMK